MVNLVLYGTAFFDYLMMFPYGSKHVGILSQLNRNVLIMIGGISRRPVPVVGVQNTARLLYVGCGKNLNSGIERELCGSWCHYSCGSVKAPAAERENWNCNKCRSERVRMLQEELQNPLRQIDELKARNRELEAKLLMAGPGERDTMPATLMFTKCVVVGDTVLRIFGADHADMMVECFPGIKIKQLHGVTEKSDLGSPESVLIIHICTNDLRTTRNLDFLVGEVYALVATAKRKLPNCRLVLSGVLRLRDVSWRRIGARTQVHTNPHTYIVTT